MNAQKLSLYLFLISTCPVQAQVIKSVTPDSLAVNVNGVETGSVDVVNQDRMNKGLVNNPLSALNGKVAGVNISNGEDRMAAQYGSRGASGVIEVTTKKGSGAAFHISYDGSWGIEDIYKNIEMLSASEYVATAKSLGVAYKDDGYDTNFPDAITRTGFVQNHHVAFSGGGPSSNYRASLAYSKNTTVLDMKGMDNLVAKLDISQKAFDDYVTINFGVFGSSQKVKGIFDEQMLFYSAAEPYYCARCNH